MTNCLKPLLYVFPSLVLHISWVNIIRARHHLVRWQRIVSFEICRASGRQKSVSYFAL